MNDAFEILYIRHADTCSGALAPFSPCDVPISARGKEQLQKLTERFEANELTAVYASPLQRTVETAGALCKGLKNPVRICLMPELMEKEASNTYRGVDLSLLKPFDSDLLICGDRIFENDSSNPNGFTDFDDEALLNRAKAVVNYLKSKHTYGEKTAVVSHGSFGNYFLRACLDLPYSDFIFSHNHTGVSKIRFTPDGKVRLLYSNNFSHLGKIDDTD